MFVCVCVYCAGGLYIIHDLGGRLLHVVCVCMCEPDRAEPAGAPRLGWRPSDGGVVCVCMCEPDRAEPAYAPRLGWRPSDGRRMDDALFELMRVRSW